MTLQNKKGQGTLEFALVIVVVVAALIAMQIYMKRAFEGKLKKNTDSIGEQYDPRNTTSDFLQTFSSRADTVTNSFDVGGQTNSTSTSNSVDSQTRSGTETVGPLP